MQRVTHLDFETFSILDVKHVGAYRYAEDPSTEILICCYAIDSGPVRTWLPWKQPGIPVDLEMAVRRGCELGAHNAQFERAIWEGIVVPRHGGPRTKYTQWICTAVLAAQAGLPRSLDNATKALNLPHKKDAEGKRLIRMFCGPRKPTKKDARTRILPTEAVMEFKEFIRYCQGDVEAERGLHAVLPPLNADMRRIAALDMRINERGIPFDIDLVHRALPLVQSLSSWVSTRAEEITGGIKPTQVAKLRDWINENHPTTYLANLQKTTLEDALIKPGIDPVLEELLEIRLEAGMVSHKKFQAMLRVCSPSDGRARGTIMLYGAHTGRWSGKLIQPHNFTRGLLKPHQQQHVFDGLWLGDPKFFLALWDKPISAISQCIRGFIKATDGRRFIVVDYAAIEARVLAWLAGQQDLIEAFRRGFDVYKLMATKLYHCSMEEVTTEQRRISKNLVLGCGYQLGWLKFIEYCARAGVYITEELSQLAVGTYRSSYPKIVHMWTAVNNAAIVAVQRGQRVEWGKLAFEVVGEWLTVELPSGRRLYYLHPKVLATMRFGKPALQLTFREDFNGTMVRASTYGGKLVENIVQGVAFDIMACGMSNCEEHGDYPMVGTVHDEGIAEPEIGRGTVHEMERLMCTLPKWADGCPVGAEGFETVRYRKN